MSIQPPFVYLAGPILNCTQGEANDWRVRVNRELEFNNITGISPLRCEPLIGERYLANYPDPKFGTSKAIAAKNKFDVERCDLVFAYLPKVFTERKIYGRSQDDTFKQGPFYNLGDEQKRDSIGTLLEIGWASHGGNKPIIIVTDDEFLINHPVLAACCGWCLPTLEDGIEVTIGLLGGYAGGKNV